MNFRSDRRRKTWVTATLDITPMVDVIFQLLIFFFYTANFIQNPYIPVKLSKASSAVSADIQKNLVQEIAILNEELDRAREERTPLDKTEDDA